MNKSTSTYRVIHKWPSTSWRYVPEHDGICLKRAREVYADGLEYKKQGMRQKIIKTTVSEKVIKAN